MSHGQEQKRLTSLVRVRTLTRGQQYPNLPHRCHFLRFPLHIRRSSRGGAIVTFSHIGANVVAQGTGTLDVASLTLVGPGTSGDSHPPRQKLEQAPIPQTTSTGASLGPTSFSTGEIVVALSTSGNIAGNEGAVGNYLITPDNYTSDTTLSGSATWDSTNISGLGLTPGTYTWNWGSGATADFFEVVPASVPEPTTMFLWAAQS